uniref:Sulfatase-modifying factor enzyme-like domain-containing protein n=1 Tax=Cyanothece sp. (strain PCC 7425 / ATCC 29141) TaxID=395961 RepID=B8HMW0_CYAP4
MSRLVIHRQKRTAQYFTEDLGNGVGLDMVLIPGGSFQMGSHDTELDHQDAESPQHLVTVPTFFMGRYPVIQAQWREIARLEKVKRQFERNPFSFRGNQRPVEQISWNEAVEFCDRLSKKTGRTYRLPTEAEWEYACRAGTTTPFHFGETITTELANYDGNVVYGNGLKGEYRQQTTDVGIFPANAFGLNDMHGNVWEWCLDHWHDNYKGALADGSAWVSNDKNAMRVRRGGSWDNGPRYCRSAYRNRDFPYIRNDDFGFRVVCVIPRTP